MIKYKRKIRPSSVTLLSIQVRTTLYCYQEDLVGYRKEAHEFVLLTHIIKGDNGDQKMKLMIIMMFFFI